MKFKINKYGTFNVITPTPATDEILNPVLLKSEVISSIETGETDIAIDFSEFDYISSGIIGILLSLYKTTIRYSGKFVLIIPNRNLLDILDRTGTTKVLKVYASLAELGKESGAPAPEASVQGPGSAASPGGTDKTFSEFELLKMELGGEHEKPKAEAPFEKATKKIMEQELKLSVSKEDPPPVQQPPIKLVAQGPASAMATKGSEQKKPELNLDKPKPVILPKTPEKKEEPIGPASVVSAAPEKPAPESKKPIEQPAPVIGKKPLELKIPQEELSTPQAGPQISNTLESRLAASDVFVSKRRPSRTRGQEKQAKRSSKAPVIIIAIIVVLGVAGALLYNKIKFLVTDELPGPQPALNNSTPDWIKETSVATDTAFSSIEETAKNEVIDTEVTPKVEEPEAAPPEPVIKRKVESTPKPKPQRRTPPPKPVGKPEREQEPVPAIEAPPAAPASSGATGTIFIATTPALADIYLGDKFLGKSQQDDIELPVGKVTLTFKKGGLIMTREFDIEPGVNKSPYVVLKNDEPGAQ
jgi:anti-anti-sigma factor